VTEHLFAQLTDTSAFEPAGAALDLISQVEEAVNEINARRPLSHAVLNRLHTDILYDRVHSSAVTEGNSLSRRETIVVLTTGLVEAGSRKDRLEVKNLAEAILALEEALNDKSPMKPFFLRNLHALVMKDLDNEVAGKYRDYDLAISGAKVRPPSFLDVSEMVRLVLDAPAFDAADLSSIQKAAWAHWAIARIHPFGEGNGRTARLVQDYVLLRDQYVPAPLSAEDREGGYYAALESADFGDGKPLLELVEGRS
jgi:Fic family protein